MAGAYEDAGHGWHTMPPGAGWNDPAGHGVHTSAPASEYEPEVQGWHCLSSVNPAPEQLWDS